MIPAQHPATSRQQAADDLPGRPANDSGQSPNPAVGPADARGSSAVEERMTEQHNVRIRPSTKARLTNAVDKLRYETRDRTISLASLTDEAINFYLDKKGC